MGHYSYEARDKEGRKIKGEVEVENEETLRAMLREMEFVPVHIAPAKRARRAFHYVGRDASGERREGSVEAEDSGAAVIALRAMGIQAEIVSSSSKNLDTPFDDTGIDKLAKGLAKPLILLIFGATCVFLMTFPGYWLSKHLDDTRSRVVEGRIVQREKTVVEYAYQVDGAQYRHRSRLPAGSAETLLENAPIAVRHSIRYPSLSRLGKSPAPKPSRAALLSGLVLAALVLILFYASAFHYIARIRKARSEGKPAPPDDVRRLLTNAANSIMFPLIFGCMIGSFMGQNDVSFYHPYRFYFIGGSVLMVTAALYIMKKSPVYYD